MNKVIETIYARRSCRSYDVAKSVKKEDLQEIMNAATQAPTAMNTRAWHFAVVSNSEALKSLNAVVRDSVDEATRKRIEGRSADGSFNFFYNAPTLIIVSCSDSSPYPAADCACALENMFLAATSLGLGTCWINQLTNISFEKKVRQLLKKFGVPDENKVYGCCALGYAASAPAQKAAPPDCVTFVE